MPILPKGVLLPLVSRILRILRLVFILLPDNEQDLVQQQFVQFASNLNIKVHTSLAFTAGTLWFV